MPHVLFMFLGAPRDNYKPTIYGFPSGNKHPASLFGLALLKELTADKEPVDEIVVLGTSGSAWDNFIADVADEHPPLTQLRAAQADSTVTADVLRSFQETVLQGASAKGLARNVCFEIISYGLEKADQIGFVETVAGHVSAGDRITFDVTNGFRHFPLMGMQAAIAVKRLRGAEIAGIWYGVFDHPQTRRTGITPAISLDGFANLTDWIEALAAFDADGTYGRFSRLLKDGGVKPRTAEVLRVAGFREHVGDLADARTRLAAFREKVANEEVTGGARLFLPLLLARTAWAEEGDAYKHYRALAVAALEAGDWVRTARFAYEAALTRVAIHFGKLKDSGDVLDRDVRAHASDVFVNGGKASPKAVNDFVELRQLRHMLVHGRYLVPQRHDTKAASSDMASLRRFLQEKIDRLIPGDPKQPF